MNFESLSLSEIHLVLCSTCVKRPPTAMEGKPIKPVHSRHFCKLFPQRHLICVKPPPEVEERPEGTSQQCTMQTLFSWFLNDTMQNQAAMLRSMSDLPSGMEWSNKTIFHLKRTVGIQQEVRVGSGQEMWFIFYFPVSRESRWLFLKMGLELVWRRWKHGEWKLIHFLYRN